jgi:protein disulfide-isomerase A1
MKYSLGLIGLAAIAAASDVVDLGKDTFEDFTKENNLVLAECKCKRRYHFRKFVLTLFV